MSDSIEQAPQVMEPTGVCACGLNARPHLPMSGLPKDRTELPSSPVGVLVPRSRAVVSSEEPLWG
jgi:hypothetical protein